MPKLIAVRIPDELYNKIERSGKTTDVVLAALNAYFDVTPRLETPCSPEHLAEIVSDLVRNRPEPKPVSLYERPAHDPTCKCWTCKPPKA